MTQKERKDQNEHFLNFKNSRAFKYCENFTDIYTISEKELGRGMSGKVLLGSHNKSNVPCAIKMIKKEDLKTAEVYEILMR